MDYVETTWLRRLDEPKYAGHVPCGVLYKSDQSQVSNSQPRTQEPISIVLVVSTAHCCSGCVQGQYSMEQHLRKRKAEEAVTNSLKKMKPTPPKHGQRLFFAANIHWFDQYVRKKGDKVKLLLDCGCTGPILNGDFIQRHHLPWVKRDHPITVQTADGTPMEKAGDKHTEEVILRIRTHQEELTWEISRQEDSIYEYLPISWLQLHNPDVQQNTGKMTWWSEYCKKHCLCKEVWNYLEYTANVDHAFSRGPE